MTGYATAALPQDAEGIAKPFTLDALMTHVRSVVSAAATNSSCLANSAGDRKLLRPNQREMLRISISSFPNGTRSPTTFPMSACAKGEAYEIVPCRGSASSSPTIL